ncbi:MAG: threonylcarbamoyl-AMP synthase [Desulfurivibrio sp.]|jgi:L-threonylcarbamoyladenylate synthase|nr:MAG: threonylcarbamoyl-AMP synthase [Desulfurivibrio sp.]
MVATKQEEGADPQAGSLLPTAEIRQALTVIRQGGVVAIPTETYYGLAVDPFNEEAVARLFALKRRPSAKPLLTLIASLRHLETLTPDIPALYLPLLDFWPGPLTLVFAAHPSLSPLVTGETGTVGARISSHPVAQCLVRELDQPVTATSANISGAPAAVSAAGVRQAFGGQLDFVLDGGTTPGGKGSTLVGLRQGRLALIRAGVISFAEITEKARLTQGS